MKKTLLIVAMLLSVAPVMAATTITAVNEGITNTPDGNAYATVRVDYTTDVDVRAFALDINIESGPAFQRIRNFKVGESNAVSKGYGIFPSRFRDFIVVTAPNWADGNYIPTTAWNEPETTNHDSGMGYPKMIVEMGTLYSGDANKPALSGTLFRFDVNSYGAVGTYHVNVAANALRGGVVDNSGAAITPTLTGATITFAAACITPLNRVGIAKATAEAAWTGQGLTNLVGTGVVSCVQNGNIITQDTACIPGATQFNYTYGINPSVPNVVSQLPVDANALITGASLTVGTRTFDWSATVAKGKIISQNPAAGTQVACNSAVTYVVSQGPTPVACFDPCGTGYSAQKAQYTLYINAKWDANSWCEFPIGSGFQCHGDADGKATAAPASLRVYSGDLSLITANWGLKLLTFPAGANPAADIDHKATAAPASIRVYTLDLARLTSATTGNWSRKGCPTATATLPRNCPLTDAKNSAYVKPAACSEVK